MVGILNKSQPHIFTNHMLLNSCNVELRCGESTAAREATVEESGDDLCSATRTITRKLTNIMDSYLSNCQGL